jgi:two-component system, cell cycle response regulator
MLNEHTEGQRPAPIEETGSARVLIVDDEPVSVRLMSAQLQKTGWVTMEASGGEEAIMKAKEDPPDLILMDVLMPGLNGYEATRRLKADSVTRHIPIILVTGLSSVEDKLDGLRAGADEFLSKPVASPELILRIKNMLKLRHYEEQLRYRAVPDDASITEQGPEEWKEGRFESARILVLACEGDTRKSIHGQLEGEGYLVTSGGDGALALLDGPGASADLVILDAELPGADSLETWRRLKEEKAMSRIPLAVITGENDTEERVRFLTLGADDLLSRPVEPRELAARVGRLLKQKAYFDSLRSRYHSAVAASNSDGLTRLFNHAYFQKFLELELKRSQRQNHPTTLILLDLDDFKSKNDTLGHVAGDHILSEVGRRIRRCIREIDVPARYGGEEFAVVLPYTGSAGAQVVAERIRKALDSEPFLPGTPASEIRVTASIGLATCPENGTAPDDLTRAADSMVYRSKREGKNRVSRMILASDSAGS